MPIQGGQYEEIYEIEMFTQVYAQRSGRSLVQYVLYTLTAGATGAPLTVEHREGGSKAGEEKREEVAFVTSAISNGRRYD